MGFSYGRKLFGGGSGAGSSGATPTYGSLTKAMSSGVALPFVTLAIADGATAAGEVSYAVETVSGTDLQRLKGHAQWSASRTGAAYAVSIVDLAPVTLVTPVGETLTGAITMAGAAGLLTFTATFTTSLGAPTMTFAYQPGSMDTTATFTPL